MRMAPLCICLEQFIEWCRENRQTKLWPHVFFLPTIVESMCGMFDLALSNLVSFSGRRDNFICLHCCNESEQVIYLR